MRNRIKPFLDERGITPYQFWKKTGIAQRTAYDLYNLPEQYPNRDVMEKICSTFRIQPGDLLEWVEDGPPAGSSDRPSTSTPPPAPEPPAKASRRSSTRRAAKDPSGTAQFGVGDCVRLPSGDRAYIDSVEGDYAHITWEMSKAEDFTPLHLLTLVHKAA